MDLIDQSSDFRIGNAIVTEVSRDDLRGQSNKTDVVEFSAMLDPMSRNNSASHPPLDGYFEYCSRPENESSKSVNRGRHKKEPQAVYALGVRASCLNLGFWVGRRRGVGGWEDAARPVFR